MLILSRKPGESIVIDEQTVVTVLQIGPGRVRLGVAAPGHVPVYRQEIHQRIQAERRAGEAVSPASSQEPLGDEPLDIEVVVEQLSAV